MQIIQPYKVWKCLHFTLSLAKLPEYLVLDLEWFLVTQLFHCHMEFFSGEVYAKMNLFYLKFFFYCLLISNIAFFCVLLLKVQVSRRRLNFIQTFNTQNAIFIWVFKYFFSFGKLYPSSLWMSSNANAKMLGILLPTNVLLIL